MEVTMHSIANDLRSIASKLLNEVGPNPYPDELNPIQERHLNMAYDLLDDADALDRMQNHLTDAFNEIEYRTQSAYIVLTHGLE